MTCFPLRFTKYDRPEQRPVEPDKLQRYQLQLAISALAFAARSMALTSKRG
jgi:hypothetical protein